MAIIYTSRISKLKSLLIDDMVGMRANLRAQLLQLGIQDVVQAASAADALKAISRQSPGNPFDLVLCDYNLGGSTNGQQLLEYVRSKKLLLPATVWFMVTAETSYDYVATATDFAPDDYLIKPFTATNLESRLLRHFERQDALEPALKRMSAGDVTGAIAQFTKLAEAGSKFTMDALRLKADCLTGLGRHEEAKAVFAQALSIRQGVPWAELGFAYAMYSAGETEQALTAATALTETNPNLVGAYELIAAIHQSRGENAQALEVLQKAEDIVPSAKRSRALAQMAARMGNMEIAASAYAKVVASTRRSVTKDPYDNIALAQVYLDTGEPVKALDALHQVLREFPGDVRFQTVAASAEARAHRDIGDEAAADAALARALESAKNADPETALAVSKACFALGKDAEGEGIVTDAVRANHEDAQLVAAAKKVLKDAEREDAVGRVVDAAVQQMLGLTGRAIELAEKAQISEAQAVIAESIASLPNNVGVLAAAAQVDLLAISQKGMDVETATRVREYLARIETLAQGSERVAKMTAFFHELLLKARAEATT